MNQKASSQSDSQKNPDKPGTITMKDKYQSFYNQYLYERDQDQDSDTEQPNYQVVSLCAVWPRPKFMLQITPHYSQSRSSPYQNNFNLMPVFNRSSKSSGPSQAKLLSIPPIPNDDLKIQLNSSLSALSSAPSLEKLVNYSLSLRNSASQGFHIPEQIDLTQDSSESFALSVDSTNDESNPTTSAALKYQQQPQKIEYQKKQQMKQSKKFERQPHTNLMQDSTSINEINVTPSEQEQQPLLNFIETPSDLLNQDQSMWNNDNIMLKKTKSRQNFTPQQRALLERFFYEHIDHPYADGDDLVKLEKQTNLTRKQIRTYMTNARMRKYNGSQNPLLRKVHGKRKYGGLNFAKLQQRNWPQSSSPNPQLSQHAPGKGPQE